MPGSIYHVLMLPTDYPGGAVPSRDFTSLESFIDAATMLGFSAEASEKMAEELSLSNKSIMIRMDVNNETAAHFGW